MKKYQLLVVFFSFTGLFTSPALGCGDYLVSAQVVMKEGASTLIINPKTKSEINLKVDFKESAKLSPYIGRLIETIVRIEEPMDATRGEVLTIGPIKVLVPDPLANTKGTQMKIVKKMECKKTKP